MYPEEKAREKIDRQLIEAGWKIIPRDEYQPVDGPVAVKESLMKAQRESDYLLYIDNKAIAVVEAKKEEDKLKTKVESQAENYARTPINWTQTWFKNLVPLVYLANGKKILFKDLTSDKEDYVELKSFHTPKAMLKRLGLHSEFGALPYFEQGTLRDCQYRAERQLEESLRDGYKKFLAVLATGSGKTYLACLASYRLLNYTNVKKVLFLVDRNNLARQTESEFGNFNLTESRAFLNQIYGVSRLRGKESDLQSAVVISTIQKLYAVLTGHQITDDNEDQEDDEAIEYDEAFKDDVNPIEITDDFCLPPDFFQFIIVDECHRSIYGKWKAVLDYFKDAKVLGLTATPTEEAYAFFNNNMIENYDYEQSIIDGVNVGNRVYDITTQTSLDGNEIYEGDHVIEVTHNSGIIEDIVADVEADYDATELDRTVYDTCQIELILSTYRDSIYSDLYPQRDEDWRYIPKTLIFAKNENHATKILECAKRVFGEKFDTGCVPEKFVQKITYTAGDTDGLIRDFNNSKEFRIAITVTLVATGTDVKPLEVVMFMKDVHSAVLYTQMKGRGCRSIGDDKLKEVTPNADTKSCFYIVDAIGVTQSDKTIKPADVDKPNKPKKLKLSEVLEHLAHGEYTDDNLYLLRDYCAVIHARYENNRKFGRHLDEFIKNYGFSPRQLAYNINNALVKSLVPDYDPDGNNDERRHLIGVLINNIQARKTLLDMHKGYHWETSDRPDTLLHAGFSIEEAKSFIDTFELYINQHKDEIEALRMIYNSEDCVMTHGELEDLKRKLLLQDPRYNSSILWDNYALIRRNEVIPLESSGRVECLTDIMQIIRFAFGKSERLISLRKTVNKYFNLYLGRKQRVEPLSEDQIKIMRQLAEYISADGAFSLELLTNTYPELWRVGVRYFTIEGLEQEMNILNTFILGVA